MNGNRNVGFPRWITAEGTIDLAELPIDGDFEAGNRSRIRTVSLCVCTPRQHGWRWTAGGWALSNWPAGLLRVRFAEGGSLDISPTSHPRTHSWQRSGASGVRISLGDTWTGCSDLLLSFHSISSNPDWKSSLGTLPSHQRCVPSFVTVARGFGFDRAQKNVSAGGTDAP